MKRQVAVLLLCLSAPTAFSVIATHTLNERGHTSVEPTHGIEAGRRVYISEGCIHCHSQYVRPDRDVAPWGPGREVEFSRRQTPALIGNRRQGPDLMNVALRRPRIWQRMHLIDPRSVVPVSRMPSYAHLFDGDGVRGEALLDYLDSLGLEAALLSTTRTEQNAGQPVEAPRE